MKLALICGSKQFDLSKSHVIGHADFPEGQRLSPRHFEIRELEGRYYVTDLRSAGGTNLRGNRLYPNVAVELKIGDSFVAGGLTFTMAPPLVEPLDHRFLIAGFIFILLFGVIIAGPTMAYGRAIGAEGLTTTFVGLAVPFFLSIFFLRKFGTDQSPASLLKYGLGVMFCTVALNIIVLKVIDLETKLGEKIAENKIRYFCLTKFHAKQCAKQITMCPDCADHFGHMDRREITYRLRVAFPEASEPERDTASEE
jgi:hypothetical protein